jgi:DNA-3-methyladenine glycosylase I
MMHRCDWVGQNKPHYESYHDNEWGKPLHDDNQLFEMLILEGAQAGLNWETILLRREGYRKAFHQFIPNRVAMMADDELEALLTNASIIRNRLKVWSARKNARVFLDIQQQYGSFDRFLWNFVDGKPIINRPKAMKDVKTTSAEAIALSNDLRKKGMSFVGPTILYAYMQATGLVNDHLQTCFLCPSSGI